MIKRSILIWMALVPLMVFSQEIALSRVEPPSWWTGFKKPGVQLMVYGKNIASARVSVDYPGFQVAKINKVGNPDYLFLDMTVSPGAKPGIATLLFRDKDKVVAKYLYELKARKKGSAERKGFTASDVIYLVMPDRFANGDASNDNAEGMVEPAGRANPDGRHGGDIKGIMDHLDYLKDLGVTSLWLTPVLENNQEKYSYHGYSITDHYRVDPRFGTNEDYVKLGEMAHQRGLKLIMDVVLNHCGSGHWWMKDLPAAGWLNQWPETTRTNYRVGTVTDPYASGWDSNQVVRGWFDLTMPDLNQRNQYLQNYLVQNSIWWIEYAGLDGIRLDTHPYAFKDMTAAWCKRILEEYPSLNIVGECWMNYPGSVAYWQKDALNRDRFNSWLPSVFDFPLYDAMNKAFNETEGWNTGTLRLYEILAQDMVYANPMNLVVFSDNHDVTRFPDTQKNDLRKMKMAAAFVLTTRGIPQIYYGTEIGLPGGEYHGDGLKRRDFPGGWAGDGNNAFTSAGRTAVQNEMFGYMQRLLQWRKSSEAVRSGKFCHFIPKDGMYTYFRFTGKEAVMVILNNNEDTKTLETRRFDEFLKKYKSGTDVVTGAKVVDLNKLNIQGKSAMIIELK